MGALLGPGFGTGSKEDVTTVSGMLQVGAVGIVARISILFAHQLGRRWRAGERMAKGARK